MDLGDGVGWVLVEHHRDVPRVLASSHVLLVGTLQLDHNYKLNSDVGITYIEDDVLAVFFLEPPIPGLKL